MITKVGLHVSHLILLPCHRYVLSSCPSFLTLGRIPCYGFYEQPEISHVPFLRSLPRPYLTLAAARLIDGHEIWSTSIFSLFITPLAHPAGHLVFRYNFFFSLPLPYSPSTSLISKQPPTNFIIACLVYLAHRSTFQPSSSAVCASYH